MTNLTILGKINEHFVKSAILDIYLKWKIPSNIEEIFVTDNPKHFKKIESSIPNSLIKDFRNTYLEDPTSMSITAGKFDLIIISISQKNEQYLKKNSKALQGVIAHELMHIVQRRQHIDRKVRADAIRAFKAFKPKLKKLYKKYNKADVDQTFAEVGRQANFVLKDLYANEEIIKVGLGDCILADYAQYYINQGSLKLSKLNFTKHNQKHKCSSTSKKECKDIFSKKITEQLSDRINFELGLLPVIIPFGRWYKRENFKDAKLLLDFLGDYYETHVPEVAKEIDPLIKYSFRNFSNSQTFRKAFFRQIFEVTEKLLVKSQ
tara:strand:+ start:3633 stop:4592 length:960 start_codon:yes stop_codon:yes gene_type:complete